MTKTSEQVQKFWSEVSEIESSNKRRKNSAAYRYASRARQAIADAYFKYTRDGDGNWQPTETWQPRPGKDEAIEIADALIEAGVQSVVFGSARIK